MPWGDCDVKSLATQTQERSSNRAQIIEHEFLARIMEEGWFRRRPVSALRSEVDDSGYDLVLDDGTGPVYIQMKSQSGPGGKRMPVAGQVADRRGFVVLAVLLEGDRNKFEIEWRARRPNRREMTRRTKQTRGKKNPRPDHYDLTLPSKYSISIPRLFDVFWPGK